VSSTARTRPPVATPSRRPSGVVRATFYGPSVKHGTDACKDCTSIRTTVRAIGFGAPPIARSNPINSWGFKRLLRATFYAETQTGLARAPSLYPVIGVAAPITTSRSYSGHRGMNTGHERDSYSVVTPARRAPDFRPADAGGIFFGFSALVRHGAFFAPNP